MKKKVKKVVKKEVEKVVVKKELEVEKVVVKKEVEAKTEEPHWPQNDVLDKNFAQKLADRDAASKEKPKSPKKVKSESKEVGRSPKKGKSESGGPSSEESSSDESETSESKKPTSGSPREKKARSSGQQRQSEKDRLDNFKKLVTFSKERITAGARREQLLQTVDHAEKMMA